MLNPKKSSLRWALICLVALGCTSIAVAQLPIPPSTQFDITGFLQSATLATPGDAHSGGTLTVNGHLVTVPRETIVIYPANALSWGELFTQAPAPYGPSQSGMAMADTPAPLSTYEVQVQGNIVAGNYIAGLIYISQEFLGTGAGFINFIDYTLGEMRVGGPLGVAAGARIRLNDPTGRYGRATTSPDIRFTVDPDNPTIMAGTGYPMCLPRLAPDGDAALCPQKNRPLDPNTGFFLGSFRTANVSQTIGVNGTIIVPPFPDNPATMPDSHFQAPFEVGDYITYSGTLVQDCATSPSGGCTAGPWPVAGAAATWVAAHTIVSNVAIYTFPGSDPAYLETDVFILGTGGLSVLGVGEAAIRTRFEGMTTDVADVSLSSAPQRIIHLYGMDLTPAGAVLDRTWGVIGVDPGAPLGAVKGRWRFRPPCAPFGTVVTKPDKQCVMNALDTFLPVTREMRSVIEGDQSQVAALIAGDLTKTSANGLFYGQYHAPILEYIFPENVPGTAPVENNFNTFPYLACGGYTSSAGTLAGQLNPWPSNIVPSLAACPGAIIAPTVTASASPNPAAAGALVTLSATVTGSPAPTVTWSQTSGVPGVVLSAVGNNATFTAPGTAAGTTLGFTVTATNGGGTATATASVVIDAAGAPTVSYQPPNPAVVASGQPFGPFTASCTDPGGFVPCTFLWTQPNNAAPGVPNLIPNPGSPTPSIGPFTVIVPIGQPAITIQLQVVATNSVGVASAPEFTNVTVNPSADQVVITSSVYRFGKQRLDITATELTAAAIAPTTVFFVQPYLTQFGTTYDPDPLHGGVGNVMTNTGGGLYTITMVGAPEPACNAPLLNIDPNRDAPCTFVPLTVRSNLGGISPLAPLNKTRQ